MSSRLIGPFVTAEARMWPGRGPMAGRARDRGPMGGGVVVTARSPQLCAGRARTQAAAARPSEARVDGAITELCFTTNASCKHFSHPWFSINYLQNIYKPLQFLDFSGQSVAFRSGIWCIDKHCVFVSGFLILDRKEGSYTLDTFRWILYCLFSSN